MTGDFHTISFLALSAAPTSYGSYLGYMTQSLFSMLHVFCRVRSMLLPVSAYSSQPSLQNSPWSPAFPPAPPPLVTQFCSALSLVLRRCLTSQQRTRQDYGHRPSLTDPPTCLPTGTAEISRFSNIECPRMLRFFDSAGPVRDFAAPVAAIPCCLPCLTTRSAPRMGDFGALFLACVFPCQRFTCFLAAARA